MIARAGVAADRPAAPARGGGSHASSRLGLIRAGLAAAAAVSPALAACAAERLFLSPPRRRPTRSDREALAPGEPFEVAAGECRVRAWRFGEGPAVVLAHGWGGRGSHLAAFVPPLVSAGCTAVLFDAPAHGASGGRLASGTTFAEAIRAVSASVGARAAVGHSMGATALGWAIADGLDLRAAVLLAPPRSAGGFLDRFCDVLGLADRVREAVRGRISRRYGLTPEEFDLVGRTDAPATPLLVVHDLEDREVPWTDGEEIARAWRGAALVRTQGLGHRAVRRDPAVVARVLAFVLSRLDRCPCGRPASRTLGRTALCERCAVERELYDRDGRERAGG